VRTAFGSLCFPIGHLYDFFEAGARPRRDRHALHAEVDRIHAFVRRHFIDK